MTHFLGSFFFKKIFDLVNLCGFFSSMIRMLKNKFPAFKKLPLCDFLLNNYCVVNKKQGIALLLVEAAWLGL